MTATDQLQHRGGGVVRGVRMRDGPWMAKKEWAAGRIADGSVGGVVIAWLFALVWNALACVIASAALNKPGPADWRLRGIAALFALVGLAIVGGAIHLTVRYKKFGRSYFELETLPGCIRGWLAGTVRTRVSLRDAESVRLALRCTHRETRGHGKGRRTIDHTIWEDEQTLTGKLATDRDGGSAVPVAFRIPGECQPTRVQSLDDIIWRLRIRAAMPGADYAADFTVPVFAERQPDDFVPQAELLAAKLRAPRATVVALDDPHIDISVNAAGRRRFVFPARCNRRTAMTLTLFAVIFGGAGIAMGIGGALIVFPIVFGAFGIAFAYGASIYWFRHVELFVDRHGIERRWRALCFGGQRTIAAGDVLDIRKQITAEASGTPYHSILAVTPGGKEFSLVSNLRTADAAHVLEEITNAIGTPTPHSS